jgi:hypothetical protein
MRAPAAREHLVNQIDLRHSHGIEVGRGANAVDQLVR